jgi:hypothetical protein
MANKYTKQIIDMSRVKTLYESGLTQKEVAKKMGTSQKVIFLRLKQEGYKSRIAKKRNQYGENNSSWKGIKAGYKVLHYRVNTLLGKPKKCEVCNSTNCKRYEWANLTGDYSNPQDYKRMCKSCHAKQDKIVNNFKGGDLCQ